MIRYFLIEEVFPEKLPPKEAFTEVTEKEWSLGMKVLPGSKQHKWGEVHIDNYAYIIKAFPKTSSMGYRKISSPVHIGMINCFDKERIDLWAFRSQSVFILDTPKERIRRSRMGFVTSVAGKAPRPLQ